MVGRRRRRSCRVTASRRPLWAPVAVRPADWAKKKPRYSINRNAGLSYNSVMGKHRHILMSKNPDASTGMCKQCGPVDIRLKGVWRCLNGIREQRGTGGPDKRRHGLGLHAARKFKEGKACAICGSTTALRIDHSHSTKEIRGVLCQNCNVGIGHMKESVAIMRKAIKYLTAFQKTKKPEN